MCVVSCVSCVLCAHGCEDSSAASIADCVCTHRDVSYRGFWFAPWLFGKPEAERQAVIQKTLQLMEQKVLDPPIGEYVYIVKKSASPD